MNQQIQEAAKELREKKTRKSMFFIKKSLYPDHIRYSTNPLWTFSILHTVRVACSQKQPPDLIIAPRLLHSGAPSANASCRCHESKSLILTNQSH